MKRLEIQPIYYSSSPTSVVQDYKLVELFSSDMVVFLGTWFECFNEKSRLESLERDTVTFTFINEKNCSKNYF